MISDCKQDAPGLPTLKPHPRPLESLYLYRSQVKRKRKIPAQSIHESPYLETTWTTCLGVQGLSKTLCRLLSYKSPTPKYFGVEAGVGSNISERKKMNLCRNVTLQKPRNGMETMAELLGPCLEHKERDSWQVKQGTSSPTMLWLCCLEWEEKVQCRRMQSGALSIKTTGASSHHYLLPLNRAQQGFISQCLLPPGSQVR